MNIPAKYHIPLLLIVCLCIFFPHLDLLYVNIMEARNFSTAREMLHHDNWILTTLNGEPRYEKPPLPTWLAAVSGAVFGIDKLWALRLPSALISTLAVVYTYRLSIKMLLPAQQAFVNSLILATSFFVIFAGRDGSWDIFAHSLMLVAIYFLFCFFTSEKQVYKNALLAGISLGLSFLSKGPVSHYALLLPFLIAFVSVYKLKGKGLREKIIPFILLALTALLLSSWWIVWIYIFDPDTAVSIAGEEANAWTDRHIRPFYYYWSFFAQSGVWLLPAFVGLLYPYLKNRVSNLKVYRFSLIWTLTAVVLLSLIPEKKTRYLLPVMIPLAINTGFYIEYLMRRFSVLENWKEKFPVYFNFGLLGSILLMVPIAGYFFLDEYLEDLWKWFILLSIIVPLIGIALLYKLKQGAFESVFYLTIFLTCITMIFFFPLFRFSYTNADYKEVAPVVEDLKTGEVEAYLYQNSSPELIWDLGQRLPVIRTNETIQIPDHENFMVFVEIDKEEEFREVFSDYSLELKDTYDGNITVQADRNYKTRRVARLYEVTED